MASTQETHFGKLLNKIPEVTLVFWILKILATIAPGKLADVVLVGGDPATNISDIRKIELVVKDGVVYRSADLYKALGIKQR